MRRYETIFITLPELSEEEHTELHGKINSVLASLQGDLIKIEDWGIKKLNFEIRKNSRGHYYLMDYAANPDLVRELERNLRLSDRVLRFQTVKLSDELNPEALTSLKETAPADKPTKTTEGSEPPKEAEGAMNVELENEEETK